MKTQHHLTLAISVLAAGLAVKSGMRVYKDWSQRKVIIHHTNTVVKHVLAEAPSISTTPQDPKPKNIRIANNLFYHPTNYNMTRWPDNPGPRVWIDKETNLIIQGDIGPSHISKLRIIDPRDGKEKRIILAIPGRTTAPPDTPSSLVDQYPITR